MRPPVSRQRQLATALVPTAFGAEGLHHPPRAESDPLHGLRHHQAPLRSCDCPIVPSLSHGQQEADNGPCARHALHVNPSPQVTHNLARLIGPNPQASFLGRAQRAKEFVGNEIGTHTWALILHHDAYHPFELVYVEPNFGIWRARFDSVRNNMAKGSFESIGAPYIGVDGSMIVRRE